MCEKTGRMVVQCEQSRQRWIVPRWVTNFLLPMFEIMIALILKGNHVQDIPELGAIPSIPVHGSPPPPRPSPPLCTVLQFHFHHTEVCSRIVVKK